MAISVPVNARMMIGGSKYCFAKFLDHTTKERVQNPDSLCGNRDPLLQRTSNGRLKVAFTTFHDPTVPILQLLLPLAGTTLNTGTYTANQTVATTEIIVDKVGGIHKYTNCRMSRMILRGQVGTLPISAECLWIGETEVLDPGAVWVDGTVGFHFGFPGTTYSIATVAKDLDRFAFVIDNKLIPSWNASTTLTDVGAGPRQTLLAISTPYTDASLYFNNRDITTGVAQALVFANSTNSFTINFPKAIYVPESPPIEGAMEEIRLPMTWEAHRELATPAFNIVNTTL